MPPLRRPSPRRNRGHSCSSAKAAATEFRSGADIAWRRFEARYRRWVPTVHAVTGTSDPARAREALADLNLVFQLCSQVQAFAHEERTQEMGSAIIMLTATLAVRS